MSDVRCKCGFPTFTEARRNEPTMPEHVWSRSHRVHHDEWAATATLEPDNATVLVARSVAVEHELRLARLEAAVVSLGVDLPALGPVDRVLRQTAGGRIEAQREER